MLASTVVGVDGDAVTIADAAGTTERIPARTIVWAAESPPQALPRGGAS
jgi:hypothetical protein